jgi:malyl-CoA/(S)-citramalyl-CoA lyase
MVPKVEGPEDIHYVDRLACSTRSTCNYLKKPILVHAILETARGVANVEEICGASPRMQGHQFGAS